MSKRQLQGLGVGIRSLHAELHEGLFHSELLQRIGGSAEGATGQESSGEPLVVAMSDFPRAEASFAASLPTWGK